MSSDPLNAARRTWVSTYREDDGAAKFIDLLSPVSGVFSGPGGMPHQCLYRGVNDASYLLMPAAFRRDAKLFQRPHSARGPGRTIKVQIERELQTLIAFTRAADRQGHHIPEDDQDWRTEVKFLENVLSFTSTQKIKEWPPSSLMSALALAQHYGAPTRMLDWSLDPYVSAYFAAAEAAKKSNEVGDLAVWVVPSSLFDVNEILLFDKQRISRLPIQYVTIPWAGNDNARVQKAVFLAYRQFDIDPLEDFHPRPYDDLLVENLVDGLSNSPVLYCLTLPKREAPELLRLLAFQGYDAATMFPGLDGAVKYISESYLWPVEFGSDPRTERHKLIFDALCGIRPQNEGLSQTLA